LTQWEPDERLTFGPGPSQLSYNFARSVAADDSGRVHLVWAEAQGGDPYVYYKRSVDDGRTWEKSLSLSERPALWMERDNLLPAIAVSGLNVYVVWHEIRDGRPTILFKRSADGGDTWWPETKLSTGPGGSAHASIAASGLNVHVVWGDHRDGDEAEIYYRRSADAGATWEDERRLTDIPYDSWVPSIAASGQYVYLAWVDTRDSNEEEYIKISTDGGVTWGADKRLTENGANSWAPSIAASGKTVHLVWFDQKDNPTQPLEAEKKLDKAMELIGLPVEPAPTGVMVPHPDGVARRRLEEKLHKIQEEAPRWVERGGDAPKLQAIMGEFELMAKPASPFEAEKKLDEAMVLMGLSVEPAPPDAIKSDLEALRKRLEAKVKKIQETAPGWLQQGGNPMALQAIMEEFELTIGAGSASYSEKERKLDEAIKLMGLLYTPGPQWDLPKIYYLQALEMRVRDKMRRIQETAPGWVRGGGDPKKMEVVLKEFERTMRLATVEWEIYYKRSTDGGATWEADVRLTNAPGPSQRPSIAVSGNSLYVVWFDGRDGNDEVYHKASHNGGRSWGPDERLTDDPADSIRPAVSVSHSSVHVVWSDGRDGNAEIYYKRKAK
jgi:hypothetical protein